MNQLFSRNKNVRLKNKIYFIKNLIKQNYNSNQF